MITTLEKLERLDEPILIDGLSWREFKAVEQLLSRSGIRLSFLDGVLEIRRMPGENGSGGTCRRRKRPPQPRVK